MQLPPLDRSRNATKSEREHYGSQDPQESITSRCAYRWNMHITDVQNTEAKSVGLVKITTSRNTEGKPAHKTYGKCCNMNDYTGPEWIPDKEKEVRYANARFKKALRLCCRSEGSQQRTFSTELTATILKQVPSNKSHEVKQCISRSDSTMP